ncbi:MAG: DNA repair protein RadA, partial [Verrucomicrobia bacterium]|nr:DNA repair protein RadA [Verrucomicrobiota bacterium]
MAKQKVVWSCTDCGHRQMKWTGSCSVCQKWNTFTQELEIDDKCKRFEPVDKPAARPMRVKEVST